MSSYMIVKEDTTNKQKFKYVFITQKNDTVTRLDTAKHYICFSDTIKYFAIVGIKAKKGWWAIDKNQKLLFQVLNTSPGEPSPDELRDGMIRIIDRSGKIGFANYKGEIVIKPKFEAVSSFYKGKAIISSKCQEVLWCCEGKNEDKHYLMDCKNAGYINKEGKILKIGTYTFQKMQKQIGWKSEYDN